MFIRKAKSNVTTSWLSILDRIPVSNYLNVIDTPISRVLTHPLEYFINLAHLFLWYHMRFIYSRTFSGNEGQVGILGGWGCGAPALVVKMEQLIALGVTKFIAVGTAGTLLDNSVYTGIYFILAS